jgi:type II secretion system protein G
MPRRGFTLIELLVVIAIIGMLSSIVMASLNSAREKARDARRVADLEQIRTALELYYDDHGYYPPSDCGWDCNGYDYSGDASWDALAAELAPYIPSLPKDPLNTCDGGPWNGDCYFNYTYGNVGRSTYPAQYDLTAQLESPTNPLRCSVRHYTFYFNNNSQWCGPYSGQIYEASN